MKKILAVFGFLLIAPAMLSLSPADEVKPIPIPANLPEPKFPPPPRLAITQSELDKIKAQPDFPAIRLAATQAGDAHLANLAVLPEGFGSWVFYYACPDDGTPLVALSLTEHQCPVDKKIYSDERTIASYRGILHVRAENAAVELGWAYIYSGDSRYAAGVKRILMKLANDYPNYPPREDRWGNTGILAAYGARRMRQALDEATGIIRLAKAYDLTRTSPVWSEEDHQLVQKNLFGLTAETLQAFSFDHNHQTWYNGGLMAIASVTADAELAKKVLTMYRGYYDQLDRNIGLDGLWFEGTMAYQNYALMALREIVDAGRRMGLPLQDAPKLRSMIIGPALIAYPDGTLPVINDSDPANIAMFNWSYDWINGISDTPIVREVGAESTDLGDGGLAVLRQGAGANAVTVFLDYGQHGGGHGHFDKMNITLFANGREWLLDPGRLTYSHKEYKTWVKESAAHNTVVRDQISQVATKGQLLFLEKGDGFVACAAQTDEAFKGAVLRRSLFLSGEMLVDLFEVENPEPAQWDWFAHAASAALRPSVGDSASSPLAAETLGTQAGYQHLTTPLSWKGIGNSRWDFLSDENNAEAPRLRVWTPEEKDDQFFTATGIGYTIGQKVPALVRRRTAAKTQFVTVYDLSGKGTAIRNVTAGNRHVQVETLSGTWHLDFSPTGIKHNLVAPK